MPKRVANGVRSVATRRAYRAEIEQYTSKPGAAKQAEAAENPAWASVQTARDVHRPTAGRYLEATCEGFFECHGDRGFADDAAIVAGIGWVAGEPATLIAQEKGRDLQDRIKRNFGCPQPEGYRKSLRLMRQAERFGRAVVCFVDTQGAFCGKEAEERGQGNAIADNLYAMAGLRVPTVSVLVGEGGSGGALALALADRVAMQEHAVYSVLSPEGFASILWKDRSRAAEAAAVMRMNAYEIYDMTPDVVATAAVSPLTCRLSLWQRLPPRRSQPVRSRPGAVVPYSEAVCFFLGRTSTASTTTMAEAIASAVPSATCSAGMPTSTPVQ